MSSSFNRREFLALAASAPLHLQLGYSDPRAPNNLTRSAETTQSVRPLGAPQWVYSCKSLITLLLQAACAFTSDLAVEQPAKRVTHSRD